MDRILDLVRDGLAANIEIGPVGGRNNRRQRPEIPFKPGPDLGLNQYRQVFLEGITLQGFIYLIAGQQLLANHRPYVFR